MTRRLGLNSRNSVPDQSDYSSLNAVFSILEKSLVSSNEVGNTFEIGFLDAAHIDGQEDKRTNLSFASSVVFTRVNTLGYYKIATGDMSNSPFQKRLLTSKFDMSTVAIL